ncbi:MAG TPA: RNA-binding cell elongation regulator Jag/EloR [Candidatus Nanopelagicales bacterium]|nr:RNA-binding cell elongation regulator Jag/EloR [Candidatus Nanopelagicales bacterium]
MSEYREFTGKSVEEALRNAREAFGVGLDELDFEILTPGSRGVLGMGAEPARIVAAPRSALGGEAPKRSAAEATPLPARPPREDRGPRDDRPPRRDDRPRDDRPRDDRPRDDRPPRDGDDRVARPRDDRPPRRDDRPPRDGDDRVARPAGVPDRRSASSVSTAEEEMVQAARSLIREREELQAAEASPAALAAGEAILTQLMEHLGFDVDVAVETGETNRLNVVGVDDEEHEALGALIGRKGERLSALQHLVNLMLSRQMGEWTRVLVDVEGYRGRREQQLREIALRAADKVVESGKMLQLEPMPALERRWIHLTLRGNASVGTQSIGEEPNRRIVIIPRAG